MNLEEKVEKLRAIKIYSDLSDEDLAEISLLTNIRTFSARESVINANEPSKEVYFIFSGRVRVRRFMVDGREIIFSDLFKGSILGEYAALDLANRSTDAYAVEKSLIGVMHDKIFRELLLRYPKACMNLAVNFARVSRVSLRRIVDLSSMNAMQRVCREFLDMAEKKLDPKSDGSDIGLGAEPDKISNSVVILENIPSQAVIASRVSTARETVSRVMNTLESNNLIKRQGRSCITILDLQRLRHLVGGEEDMFF